MPGISIPHKSMTVDKITLYRSDRGKHGMIYTELGSV
jgi:2'-5' RNA ligase